MILAVSTSSPVASVALIANGTVLVSRCIESNQRAGAVVLGMVEACLNEVSADLDAVEGVVADLGPGSFTGVRVGVALAKSLAYSRALPVSGVGANKLIAQTGLVVFPSRKGEWYIFSCDDEPVRSAVPPEGDFVGFGPGIDPQVFPSAANVAWYVRELVWGKPESLLPNYVMEPSISTPKRPLSGVGEHL
ncbi:MAG: tRNA (adenosine(37)-N6)-threonylcarbamoyltransferase complex dimerization subunit type 1 TsaB [Armatimonadetes bacterium]|nr:tRNA (adenosine(37)-N6)-threonylcarbamoyltransferase complex dimerization subunit type 1 TsaB [Armatimonadota bacterium]